MSDYFGTISSQKKKLLLSVTISTPHNPYHELLNAVNMPYRFDSHQYHHIRAPTVWKHTFVSESSLPKLNRGGIHFPPPNPLPSPHFFIPKYELLS